MHDSTGCLDQSKRDQESMFNKVRALSQKVEEMSDYSQVKSHNTVLMKDLEVCRNSFADLTTRSNEHKKDQQKLVKELLNKLTQASADGE